MTKLSIITACLPTKADFISITAQSVEDARELAKAHDIELEWIICYDGEPLEPGPSNADKIVNLAHHSGVAVARNIALSLASGEYFMPLDADDVLVFEGVLKGLAILTQSNGCEWVAGNRLSLEGEKTRHWHRRSFWGAGFLVWDWTSPFPFHPSTIIMETQKALEIGGWPALPACEDVGFILEVSERFGGVATEEVFIKYREWEKQTGETEGYAREKALAYKCIESLVNSNRAKRKEPLVETPLPLP